MSEVQVGDLNPHRVRASWERERREHEEFMTKRKQKAPQPVAPVTEQAAPKVDHAAEIDVRLAVVGNTLSLLAHAPSLLNPEAIKQAENLIAQCRELLQGIHNHGE